MISHLFRIIFGHSNLAAYADYALHRLFPAGADHRFDHRMTGDHEVTLFYCACEEPGRNCHCFGHCHLSVRILEQAFTAETGVGIP